MKKWAIILIDFLKGFSYGLQALATDFAYTDQKYFTSRSLGQHLSTFSIGFMNGAMQFGGNKIGEGWKSKVGQNFNNFAFSSAGYLGQYALSTINYGYNPFTYKYAGQKSSISALKSIFYGLISSKQ